MFASAQDGSHQYRGEGCVFVGEGEYPLDSAHYGISHVGGGGEVLLLKGFSVGSELGAMGWRGDGVGLFSIDLSHSLLRARSKSKIIPFLEGGYTRAFGNRGFTLTETMFNFSAGLHYWVFKRVGLRLEFRDYVAHEHVLFGVPDHYWGFRIGLALRQDQGPAQARVAETYFQGPGILVPFASHSAAKA
jgi:hypothetical protein